MKKIENRLAEICPDWPGLKGWINEWWLCAPKSFRFLERMLWMIAKGRVLEPGEKVPGFLQCEDTFPDQDKTAAWWRSFLPALKAWQSQSPETGAVADDVNGRLGQSTPVKRWLVRLLARRLKRLEENGEQFTSLVSAGHDHKRGSLPLASAE